MPRLTLVLGGILVAMGIFAYILTAAASVTALIPAFVGILLLACGVFATRSPSMRKHATHAALAIALLGALGSLMQVVKIGDVVAGTAERPTAVLISTAMFVMLLGYLVVGVRSFVAARRSRV